MATQRPMSGGVFIVWDEEEVDVERRDIDTVRARTVVTARRMIQKYARWTNAATTESIEAAERYAESIRDQHENVRVEVIDR